MNTVQCIVFGLRRSQPSDTFGWLAHLCEDAVPYRWITELLVPDTAVESLAQAMIQGASVRLTVQCEWNALAVDVEYHSHEIIGSAGVR
jgi:hypothetical protein